MRSDALPPATNAEETPSGSEPPAAMAPDANAPISPPDAAMMAAPAAEKPGAAAAAAGVPAAEAPSPDTIGQGEIGADDALLSGRRRPGFQQELPDRVTQDNLGAVRPPPPEAFPTDQIPVPDRWRLVTALCPLKDSLFPNIGAVCHSPFDPYHQNFLKGDRPIDLSKKRRSGCRSRATTGSSR